MSRLLPALTAPLLFGAGAALSKPLLASVHPVMMAGLLYSFAGLSLGAWRLMTGSAEAPLGRRDVPRLAAVALFGGLAAPVLLMLGLARVPASGASLLLNLEAPLSGLIAAKLFKEQVGGRTALGIAAIAAGSMTLAGFGIATRGSTLGYLAIAAACMCWAIDNNLTQALSERDPVQVAAAKCGAAGLVNVTASLLLGARLPGAPGLSRIAVIGVVSYGASLVCYLASLRRIGTARTAMYFSLAPFAGAVIAVVFLREPVSTALAVSAALMAAGVWLGASDGHAHPHSHELEHEHLHVHDEHHLHHHDRVEGPHSHPHSHFGLSHTHPHDPDIHHRH